MMISFAFLLFVPRIPSSDFYKELDTTVGVEFLLEKPLLGKKKLQPVSRVARMTRIHDPQKITKSVSEFIPKREIPAYIRKQRNSQKATEEFQGHIERIAQVLVKEYQSSIRDFVPSSASFHSSDLPEDVAVCFFLRHLF